MSFGKCNFYFSSILGISSYLLFCVLVALSISQSHCSKCVLAASSKILPRPTSTQSLQRAPSKSVTFKDQQIYIRSHIVPKMETGARVVRGPDWRPYWNDDGGSGGLGTVTRAMYGTGKTQCLARE